jgi:hypothetical protein
MPQLKAVFFGAIGTIVTPGETTSDQDFSVANSIVPDLRSITIADRALVETLCRSR